MTAGHIDGGPGDGAVRVGQIVPRAFLDAAVLDAKGRPTTLGELSEGRATVFMFLRHFACLACSEHVAELTPRLHEPVRLGVRVVFVGNGAADYVDGFVQRNAIDTALVDVVTDPSLEAHRVLELERSLWGAVEPRALVNLGRALLRGFRQSSIEGDPLQHGAAVVVDVQGRVAYVHRDRFTGDHAPTSDVIEAAMRVVMAEAPIP